MELAFNRYYQEQCSIEELAEHLNVKAKKLVWSGRLPIEEAKPIMAYVFDTNSFRVLGNYYPRRFPTFWEKFNRTVSIGKIVSVREVRRELELQVHHTHLFDWIEDHKGIFLPPSPGGNALRR